MAWDDPAGVESIAARESEEEKWIQTHHKTMYLLKVSLSRANISISVMSFTVG